MQIRQIRHLVRGLAIGAGALLATALGFACLRYSFAEPLWRLSYDLPFLLRATLDTREITIVYLDEDSAKQLNQPLDDVWNRSLHVSLLDRLTREKARLVFYDISFDGPAADPAADAAFAQSIRANGKVILGAALDLKERQGVRSVRVFPPIKSFRKAAAGWGLLVFSPVDPDYGVRQMYLGTSNVPAATWKAAEVLGAPVTHKIRDSLGPLGVNYYGPKDSFASVSMAQALLPNGVPPGYFKDKIVFVGGQFAVGALRVGRDEFATPYSESNQPFTPGTEVHATILLNLLRGEWLTRMPLTQETALVVVRWPARGRPRFFSTSTSRVTWRSYLDRDGLLGLLARLAPTNLVCLAGSLGRANPVRADLVGWLAIPPRIAPPQGIAQGLRFLSLAANGG